MCDGMQQGLRSNRCNGCRKANVFSTIKVIAKYYAWRYNEKEKFYQREKKLNKLSDDQFI